HERAVEEPAGRADERSALEVLAVSWLLTDDEQPSRGRPIAEDRLGGSPPEAARSAAPGQLAKLLERRFACQRAITFLAIESLVHAGRGAEPGPSAAESGARLALHRWTARRHAIHGR